MRTTNGIRARDDHSDLHAIAHWRCSWIRVVGLHVGGSLFRFTDRACHGVEWIALRIGSADVSRFDASEFDGFGRSGGAVSSLSSGVRKVLQHVPPRSQRPPPDKWSVSALRARSFDEEMQTWFPFPTRGVRMPSCDAHANIYLVEIQARFVEIGERSGQLGNPLPLPPSTLPN